MREITCTRGAHFPRILRSEFLFDQPVQVGAYRWVIKALDDFVQKAGHEKALGDLC